jgi:hypothetical protein
MKDKEKKKYRVSIPYHATAYVTVEANSEQEAKDIALDECWPSPCCMCSDEFSIDEYNENSEIFAYLIKEK